MYSQLGIFSKKYETFYFNLCSKFEKDPCSVTKLSNLLTKPFTMLISSSLVYFNIKLETYFLNDTNKGCV